MHALAVARGNGAAQGFAIYRQGHAAVSRPLGGVVLSQKEAAEAGFEFGDIDRVAEHPAPGRLVRHRTTRPFGLDGCVVAPS